MNKEELELYDMVLNSKKSFNVNYKELAISLREEIKELQERIDKAIEYISKHNCIATYEEYKPTEYEYCCSTDLLDILKGEE